MMQNLNNLRKRRVLGDITNSNVENENIDSKKILDIKKPVSQSITNENLAPSNSNIQTYMDDRPYMNRPCDDIDNRDMHNPLSVSAFVNDIYDHFRALEKQYKVDENYMSHQELINDKMRCVLIDWLVEVHGKFKMVPESLYITVQIIDRYLELKSIRRSKLQLVGVAALMIAGKYEEIYPPQLPALIQITDQAFTRAEIVAMENDICLTLDFNFTIPTSHNFLCRFLKAAHADRKIVQLSCYLIERCLQEYSMLRFLPSQIAATAVLVARKTLKLNPWSPTLLLYTTYDESDLTECLNEMYNIINNPNNKHQSVYRKYSASKYSCIATMNLKFF